MTKRRVGPDAGTARACGPVGGTGAPIRLRVWKMAVLLLALVLSGSAGPAAAADQATSPGASDRERLSVFVSILPQSWFVERIGGNDVEVFFLVGPGDSPATFEPAPRHLVRLEEADLLLTIGVPFERMLMPRLEGRSRSLKIVDMADGIERRQMQAGAHGHGHGHDGAKDPHVWLDPVRAETLARNTRDALAALRPEHRRRYDENLDRLLEDLRALHRSLNEKLAPFEGGTVLVFHPAFGYFTDRYGLEQLAIESGGLEPGPRRLTETIDRARELGLRTVFAQPQSPSASVSAVADAIGGKVERLDPLAPRYLKNLRSIGESLRKALERAQGTR